jgi:tetratricopeptide (TPR) repeat protein
VMLQVYGFDQERLDMKWRLHLKERWPDPWQPNIAMVYLVRGNWEIDGLESGIRTALADRNIEAARRHRMYLESRRIPPSPESEGTSPLPPQDRYGSDPRLVNPVEDQNGDPGHVAIVPLYRNAKAPVVEHYEAAMACYSTGRFAEGVEHLRTALEVEPEQLVCLRIHLARGLWLTGEKKEALKLYKEELEEAEELPFLNEVAWCLERAGDKAEAIRLYQRIVESSDVQGLTDHALRRIDRLKSEQKALSEQDSPPHVARSF